MKTLDIHTDGGARGNPGPAAIGIVIKNQNNKVVFKHGEQIGKATNNQAEYLGLVKALEWVDKNKNKNLKEINCYLDSMLVVRQMQGKFKVKSPNIKSYWKQAKSMEQKINLKINYHHIPREKNFEADELLNQALDNLL